MYKFINQSGGYVCQLLKVTRKASISVNLHLTMLFYTSRKVITGAEEGLISGKDSSALLPAGQSGSLNVLGLRGLWLWAAPAHEQEAPLVVRGSTWL